MKARALLVAFSLALTAAAQAQEPRTFIKVYAGPDNLAHLVDAARHDTAMAAEPGQRTVSVSRLSADGRTAGWFVEEDNCCTSYPIATRLVLRNAETKHVVSNGFMLYDWCFADGTKVAVASGTVHSMSGELLDLYDATSGKRLQQMRRDPQARRPNWALCLKHP